MPTVPEPILYNLKCTHCKCWLSCGPIKLLPGGGSVCGRCESRNNNQFRHFAFEALACYFKFPCKNWGKHCPEYLPFKKVLEHEKKCSYGSGCSVFFLHPSAACKSRRYLDVRAGIKLEVIPDVVLEYLRCTNCAGYLSCSPIYVCRDGTSVCHRCNAQLSLPNSEFIRDLSFEVFVDIMIFPCIFRSRGCTQMYKFGNQMMEHEEDCSYGKSYVKDEPRYSQLSDPKHEEDYSYGKSYANVERQFSKTSDSKRDSTQAPQKERGIIQTHSGHIYATITPNAPLFSPSSVLRQQEQGMFLEEFQWYRDNLANKWGRANDSPYGLESSNGYTPYASPQNDGGSRGSILGRTDNVYDNTFGHPNLIEELKIRQQLRKGGYSRNNTNGHKEDIQVNTRDNLGDKTSNNLEYSVHS